MSKRLIDFTLHRAGWGKGHSLELEIRQIAAAQDLEVLPNLLQVAADEPLADILSWPERAGCALQCLYSLRPVGGHGPTMIRTAEAVKRCTCGKTFEIELVEGWPGEPHYWGNRSVHEEEVEAAIHGMAPNAELQLLSVPAERATDDTPRARILKSGDDTGVLFIASSLEEARILAGVVERLCDNDVLTQYTGEVYPLDGSSMAGDEYRRTDKKAPPVTRWLGGHGSRSQQAVEQRAGAPWPVPVRLAGCRFPSPRSCSSPVVAGGCRSSLSRMTSGTRRTTCCCRRIIEIRSTEAWCRRRSCAA